MRNNKTVEIIIGLFIIVGIGAFLVLALQVSGLSLHRNNNGYFVSAEFDHIGDLKARAPVTIAGVRVGEVADISLDNVTFRAKVQLRIDANQDKIPDDSVARIFTQGLLGSNYISLTPGYADEEQLKYLHEGSVIEETYPALILEKLISQFLYDFKKDKK